MVRKPAATAAHDAETVTDLTKEAAEIFNDVALVSDIYVDADGKPLNLISRLARIKESLPVLEPEGKNDHFNYKFVKNTQVLGALRPRLARQMIMVIPEIVDEREPLPLETKRGGKSLVTRVTVTWRVVDGISGESFTGQSVGYGDDGGDKGANKAFTAAQKNFLIRLFEIGGEPDLEEDAETDKRAKARDSGSGRVQQVVIGDTDVEGVQPGGHSDKATDAQIARVGQYVRDLQLTPEAFAKFADKVLGDNFDLSEVEDKWNGIKLYLNDLTGKDIGKLIARFDEILNEAETKAMADKDEEDRGGGGYE